MSALARGCTCVFYVLSRSGTFIVSVGGRTGRCLRNNWSTGEGGRRKPWMPPRTRSLDLCGWCVFPSVARSVLQSTGGGGCYGGFGGRRARLGRRGIRPLLSSSCPHFLAWALAPKWPRHATPGLDASFAATISVREGGEGGRACRGHRERPWLCRVCAVDRGGDSSPMCPMGCWFLHFRTLRYAAVLFFVTCTMFYFAV